MQAEPPLHDLPPHFATALADRDGDPHAHQLLEAGHVGDEVGVQIVAVEGGPESLVVGLREERVEGGELLHGFGEGGVAGSGEGGGCGQLRGEDVWGEEMEAEAEVRRGEDGEGLDEDVGGGFVAGKVGIELVAVLGGKLGWELVLA